MFGVANGEEIGRRNICELIFQIKHAGLLGQHSSWRTDLPLCFCLSCQHQSCRITRLRMYKLRASHRFLELHWPSASQCHHFHLSIYSSLLRTLLLWINYDEATLCCVVLIFFFFSIFGFTKKKKNQPPCFERNALTRMRFSGRAWSENYIPTNRDPVSRVFRYFLFYSMR